MSSTLLFYKLLPRPSVCILPAENSEDSDEEQTVQDTDEDFVSSKVD